MKYRHISIFIVGLVSLLLLGAVVCWYRSPSLETMVGQMIMTGFHGDGMGANAEDFSAIGCIVQLCRWCVMVKFQNPEFVNHTIVFAG